MLSLFQFHCNLELFSSFISRKTGVTDPSRIQISNHKPWRLSGVHVCCRWKHVGIITSNEALWSGVAVSTKDCLERRGVKVIFRIVEPSVNSDKVSTLMGNKYLCKCCIQNGCMQLDV